MAESKYFHGATQKSAEGKKTGKILPWVLLKRVNLSQANLDVFKLRDLVLCSFCYSFEYFKRHSSPCFAWLISWSVGSWF